MGWEKIEVGLATKNLLKGTGGDSFRREIKNPMAGNTRRNTDTTQRKIFPPTLGPVGHSASRSSSGVKYSTIGMHWRTAIDAVYLFREVIALVNTRVNINVGGANTGTPPTKSRLHLRLRIIHFRHAVVTLNADTEF